MKLTWRGWNTYTNTGTPYRRWEFGEAVPELRAKAGFLLDDLGPGEEPRFHVRPAGSDELVHKASLEEVEAAVFRPLGVRIPPWRPPPPAPRDPALDQELRTIETRLSAIYAKVKERVDGDEPAQSAAAPPAHRGNEWLLLKRESTWANTGETFRVWELLRDVPGIPAFRTGGVDGPAHAVAGDELWEQDDELTPFKLKRKGKSIGAPEWWQVQELFEGLGEAERSDRPPAWGHPPDTPDGRLLASVLRSGGLRKVRLLKPGGNATTSNGGKVWADAWIATEELPALDLPAGAIVLLLGRRPRKDAWDGLLGRCHQIPRPTFRVLLEQLHTLRFVDGSVGCDRTKRCPEEALDEIRSYLGRRASWTGKTGSVRVVVVRPLRSGVTAPIEARSDDEAIFELLYQANRGAD